MAKYDAGANSPAAASAAAFINLWTPAARSARILRIEVICTAATASDIGLARSTVRGTQTTTQVGQQPQLESVDLYKRGWGWWWFSSTELRTEKIVLSARYLPRGTYRFVYQIRAASPGTYRVIPANGQEFYFPEVFGRGAGSLFTVTP